MTFPSEDPAGAQRYLAVNRLIRVWCKVLGLSDVGAEDNFFDLGGDSILIIEIVARAAAEGLTITPLDMLAYQTISELAEVAAANLPGTLCSEPAGQLGARPLSLTYPLTSTHRRFLVGQPLPGQVIQSALWRCPPVDADVIRAALDRVAAHHDAFRIRLAQDSVGELRLSYAPGPGAIPLQAADLSGLPRDDQDAALKQLTATVRECLDVAAGPVAGAMLVDLGQRGMRLYLAAHHLVVDAVSWRILREDLAACCDGLTGGAQVSLPPPTTVLGVFSELAAREAELAANGELDGWLERCDRIRAPRWAGKTADRAGSRIGDAVTFTSRMPAEVTGGLLALVGKGMRMQEILAGALSWAVAMIEQQDVVALDVERHGRAPAPADADLSRSLGWFAQLHPIVITATDHVRDAVAVAASELRATAVAGVRYGELRQRSAALREAQEPAVVFNYLGWFGDRDDESFGSAHEATADDRHPDNQLSHPLECTASVEGSSLVTTFTGACWLPAHARPAIVAQAYRSALIALGCP